MRKQRIVTGTVTAVALLALAGCGTRPGSDGADSVRAELPLTGVHWTLDSVTADGGKITAPPGSGLELTSGGRASVRACNAIGADVTLRGHVLTVGESSTTFMACSGAQAFEGAFTRTFSGRLTADIDGTHLRLSNTAGHVIDLTYEPDAPLVGTRWTVTSLLRDGTATTLPAGTAGTAHFTFGRNHTVRGSQGCNSFSGTAKVSGSAVTFSRLAGTKKFCPGPGTELERRVGKIMESRPGYELGHRSLTLTAPDGTGLSAVADGPGSVK